MEARRFEQKDYDTVESWFSTRGIFPAQYHALPEIGFIVENIACGFLYKTDSSVALIENLIANPEESRENRDEALDIVVSSILDEAKKLGYRSITGITRLEPVLKRAFKHGFNNMPHLYAVVSRGL